MLPKWNSNIKWLKCIQLLISRELFSSSHKGSANNRMTELGRLNTELFTSVIRINPNVLFYVAISVPVIIKKIYSWTPVTYCLNK